MPIGVDGLVRQWTPSQSVHRQGTVTGIPGAGEDGTCDAVYGWGGQHDCIPRPRTPGSSEFIGQLGLRSAGASSGIREHGHCPAPHRPQRARGRR